MAKWLKWTINIVILSALIAACGVIYKQSATSRTMMLSCSSELFDRHSSANPSISGSVGIASSDNKFYLLVDVLIAADKAQINYRYFNFDGTSAGHISMRGKVDSIEANSMTYRVAVETKTESEMEKQKNWPEHMKYLSNISSLPFRDSGVNNFSIEVLDMDDTKDYAVVLFQPSNTICGCRIVNSRI
ncbi:hypothetical protein BM607_010030 [Shewanella sp. SACH]|uniref:hypothetical protein n=1 Tax=Shewanella sp. SACH TaxID=1873135 RepID=UPI00090370EB|nr:hypothetical protein [Shewanella sp. SACH]OUS51577.1 hypothetical protein BM607_010030 [Shewanella sp. SACH]